MNLKKILRDYIAKPVLGLGLILGTTSCTPESEAGHQTKQKQGTFDTIPLEDNSNGERYFTSIADLDNKMSRIRRKNTTIGMLTKIKGKDITYVDLDNDGDMDVILSVQLGHGIQSFVYENRIPKKE